MAKQPWNMTKVEWDRAITKAVNKSKEATEGLGLGESLQSRAKFRRAVGKIEKLCYRIPDGEGTGVNKQADHIDVVRKAIKKGKSVPAKVLADYPKLASVDIVKEASVIKCIPPVRVSGYKRGRTKVSSSTRRCPIVSSMR